MILDDDRFTEERRNSRTIPTGRTTFCSTNISTVTTAPALAPAIRPAGPGLSQILWIYPDGSRELSSWRAEKQLHLTKKNLLGLNEPSAATARQFITGCGLFFCSGDNTVARAM